MYESILDCELSERLRCALRTVTGHYDLRYAIACEEQLQVIDGRFTVGSLEFSHYEESRVMFDRTKIHFPSSASETSLFQSVP